MEYNISEMLGELRDNLLRGSLVMLAAGILSRIFSPKPTKITVQEGVPAELYVLGKKDNPKAVYVSTKKYRVNLFPPFLMLVAGIAAAVFKQKFDENSL